MSCRPYSTIPHFSHADTQKYIFNVMNFIQISFPIFSQQADLTEAGLLETGALAVCFEDAQDQPVLEPAVGETPLWDQIIIKAIYPENTDCLALFSQLAESLDFIDLETVQFEKIPEKIWERVWMDEFKPKCFGEKLWVYPSNFKIPGDHLALILDPGLAFGTGTHPTTAMCLTYLAQTNCQDKIILDFGCGSGILAIAALKLGAQKAIGIDNDPQALIATRDNADRNQINLEKLSVLDVTEAYTTPVDILVANILAAPLIERASQFAALLKPKGQLALSGILRSQAELVRQAYEPYFENFKTIFQDDWVCIQAEKIN